MNYKLQKMFKMSKDEIFFRIAEKKIELKDYLLNNFGKKAFNEKHWIQKNCKEKYKKEYSSKLFHQFSKGSRDIFFTELYEKELRRKEAKQLFDTDKWIFEAEEIYKDRLCLLGKNMMIPKGDNWHVDPVNSVGWPKIFYKLVTRNSGVETCDIKYIWELSRHQYLILLAKAYWFTGDQKYAKKVFSIIEDWISANPFCIGVNWTSSLELAVRVISWIWACFLCKDSIHWTTEFNKQLIRSVFDHAIYLEKHLSYYSSPYNHLIGEAAGLQMIGSFFKVFKKAETWESLGWNILSEQVDKQFHEDGMSIEQASFYHHFTLGFYLQATLLRKINTKSVSEHVLSRLGKALEFSMVMTKPNGSTPMIGDIDNARSIYFGGKHSWDFRGFLAIGAILFNRGDFKYICETIPEEIFWLFSDKDFEKFIKMKAVPPVEKSRPFYMSGYFISRNSWEKDTHFLYFDCGEISDGLRTLEVPSAAHGHADGLSFEIFAFGKSFISDSGFHTYFGDLEWHKYFRTEEAHNTLVIENYRQAEYCGRLKWRKTKKPELEKWISNDYFDFMSGKINYETNMKHKRAILYVKNHFWLIDDLIETDKDELSATINLHFGTNIEVSINNEIHQIIAKSGNNGLAINYFHDHSVDSYKGGFSPKDGWIARGYGIKESVPTITIEMKLKKPDFFSHLLIVPFKNTTELKNLRTSIDVENLEGKTKKIGLDICTKHFHMDYAENTLKAISLKGKEIII